MKNLTLLGILGIVIIGVAFFIYSSSAPQPQITNVDSSPNLPSQVQKVVLSEKDANYYPSTITVKSGQPVEITLDNSVKGCLRAFTVKEFGVSKYARTENDKITFTPTKTGTYTFACSMGMGYGKLIVE